MTWFDVLKVSGPDLRQRANIAQTPESLQGLRQRNIQSQNTPLPEEQKVTQTQQETELASRELDGADASDINEAERRLRALTPTLERNVVGPHKVEMDKITELAMEARVDGTFQNRKLRELEDIVEALV
tara:strand:- start:587 stop:973 length:387 start_codon:yes stop_codon:yes gene_type:complete